MGLTVREALQLHELKGIKVMGGENGLDRVIRSVNVMEVPDIAAFVHAGDLLLTTTYPIHNDPEALRQLIPTLAERNLAGVAIKPARYIDAIPEVMVEQSNRLALPLLQLPPGTSFNNIINPILSEILNRQAALLRQREEAHRSFLDLVLKGEGVEAVVNTLAHLLEMPVAVTDSDFAVLAVSDSGYDIPAFTDLLDKIRREGLYPPGEEPVRRGIWLGSLLASVLIHPIRAGSEMLGYIGVIERDGELTDRGLIYVEKASVILALVMEKQRALLEIERRFQADFLRDLLNGQIASRSEAIARGKVYGWDLTLPRVLLLLRPLSALKGHGTILEEARLRMQRRLETALHHAVEGLNSRLIMVHMGDSTVLLLSPQDPEARKAKAEATHLAHAIVRELNTGRTGECRMAIGIAAVQDDVLGWPEAYRQAQEALYLGHGLSPQGLVTHYDDLGIYRLLARVENDAELERFCAERLGQLLQYDARNGTDLLETVEAVVACDGNLQKAAEMLYVHYNTVRYRLQRIQEIQGCRVDSWRELAELDVALKVRHVLKMRRSMKRTSVSPGREGLWGRG